MDKLKKIYLHRLGRVRHGVTRDELLLNDANAIETNEYTDERYGERYGQWAIWLTAVNDMATLRRKNNSGVDAWNEHKCEWCVERRWMARANDDNDMRQMMMNDVVVCDDDWWWKNMQRTDLFFCWKPNNSEYWRKKKNNVILYIAQIVLSIVASKNFFCEHRWRECLYSTKLEYTMQNEQCDEQSVAKTTVSRVSYPMTLGIHVK